MSMDELDVILDSGGKGRRPANAPKMTHRTRTRWPWLVVAGIVVAAVILGLQLAQQNRVQPRPGEAAPDFTLTTFDGETLSLRDLRGQIVVVNFWANWCAPCHAEAPDLKAIAEDYTPQGVVMVGINWLEPSDNDAINFLARYGLTYANGPDRGERIAQSYRIAAAPETYVIDQNGVVAETIIGPITYEGLAATLDRLIASGGAS